MVAVSSVNLHDHETVALNTRTHRHRHRRRHHRRRRRCRLHTLHYEYGARAMRQFTETEEKGVDTVRCVRYTT